MSESKAVSSLAEPVYGVILAGGESRRMGADKALTALAGRPLMGHVLDVLQPACNLCMIVSQRDAHHGLEGAQLIADAYPGTGPLGGILTAMEAGGKGIYVVVGCDMPALQPAVLQLLIETLRAAPAAQAAAAVTENGIQPLCAAYRFTSAGELKRRIESGKLSLRAALAAIETRIIDPESLTRADPARVCFQNINTPEDLARMAHKMEPPIVSVSALPSTITVVPLTTPPHASVQVPGSKSITNRALILAALAEGTSVLTGALESEDTWVMIDCLTRLGFEVAANPAVQTITVNGRGGQIPAAMAELFLGNSGTSIRFLTAFAALGNGTYRLDGVERMRQRPQQDLLTALQQMGVKAVSELNNGCPPLLVTGTGELPGGRVSLNAEASSQFLTALLMVSPYAATELEIAIIGHLRPFYVDITRRMMEHWGVGTEQLPGPIEDSPVFKTPAGQRYSAQSPYAVEPDASSASYFFAAAAVTGGTVTVLGLGENALQGDVKFATDVLVEMGCTVTTNGDGITVTGPAGGKLHGVDRDMSSISDTSLTLAAIAPFADSPTTIRNIAHARKQECDRISAACTELQKLGVKVEERPDGLTIWPAETLKPASIQTYHDHRVAMSFAVAGLRAPGITIEDPACTAKTFPDFWQRLELLRG